MTPEEILRDIRADLLDFEEALDQAGNSRLAERAFEDSKRISHVIRTMTH